MDKPARTKLQLLEQEAKRLRAEYASDVIACAVIRVDLAVRRLACRLALAREGSAPCRS
jgi:hypothetical protein